MHWTVHSVFEPTGPSNRQASRSQSPNSLKKQVWLPPPIHDQISALLVCTFAWHATKFAGQQQQAMRVRRSKAVLVGKLRRDQSHYQRASVLPALLRDSCQIFGAVLLSCGPSKPCSYFSDLLYAFLVITFKLSI